MVGVYPPSRANTWSGGQESCASVHGRGEGLVDSEGVRPRLSVRTKRGSTEKIEYCWEKSWNSTMGCADPLPSPHPQTKHTNKNTHCLPLVSIAYSRDLWPVIRYFAMISNPCNHSYQLIHKGNQVFDLERHRRKPTSNQINQQKMKHKTDYENLLLLQKIQTARPSRAIEQSFDRMKL